MLVFVVSSDSVSDASRLKETKELLEASLGAISRRAPVVILCNSCRPGVARPCSEIMAALQCGSGAHWSRRSWCVQGCSVHEYTDTKGVGGNGRLNSVHDAVVWGM